MRDFCLGLGLDFGPKILTSGLIDLKETNSRDECMIRPWVYIDLDECIWVSPGSFSDLNFDTLYRLYICNL